MHDTAASVCAFSVLDISSCLRFLLLLWEGDELSALLSDLQGLPSASLLAEVKSVSTLYRMALGESLPDASFLDARARS